MPAMKTTTELAAVCGPFLDERGDPTHHEAVWLEVVEPRVPHETLTIGLRRGIVCSNDLVRDRGGVALDTEQAEALWRQLGAALGKDPDRRHAIVSEAVSDLRRLGDQSMGSAAEVATWLEGYCSAAAAKEGA